MLVSLENYWFGIPCRFAFVSWRTLRFAGEITGKNPNYINAGRPDPPP